MKALIIGDRQRYDKFNPHTEFSDHIEKVYVDITTPVEDYPKAALDADFASVDAITAFPEELMERMPNLKVIHSEGVAYNKIDVAAASRRGIYVCNNKGINAMAVAEQTIFLMLGLLRDALPGYEAVMEGHQIEKKTQMMNRGFLEIGDCRIGLIGFGDIAKATAKLLQNWGCEIYYFTPNKKDDATEKEYGVKWMDRDELIRTCDIISIHVPVTPETTGMVNGEFLHHMKNSAYLINTARGEIVDNDALADALIHGNIAGAGLDTIAPEPVAADHLLLHLPADAQKKIIFSPHIGGVTTSTFRRGHRNIWAAFEAVAKGEVPANVVNKELHKNIIR